MIFAAAALVVVLASGAVAVDLTALDRRGQTLQNTADAAALAGVAVWAETGDAGATQLMVNDLVNQNGLAGAVAVNIQFPNDTDIVVDLVDADPGVLLSGVAGFADSIARDATARLEECDAPCGDIIEIPPPFVPISASGSGDGFVPIVVEDRFYAVNHHEDSIACVDRSTQAWCWGTANRPAFPVGDVETGILAHHALVGSKIYYTGQHANSIKLHCWETVTDTPCPTPADIAPLGRPYYEYIRYGTTYTRTENSVYEDYRGGGTVEVGGKVYVFTDDHRAHCFDPALGSNPVPRCAGYGASGNQTTAGVAGWDPLDPADHVQGSNIDRIVNETNGRIYHTIQIDGSRPNNYPGWSGVWSWVNPTTWDRGIHLQCFDTVAAAACSGFTITQLHSSAAKSQAGRLFFHRTVRDPITGVGGVPNGVCSTGLGRWSIECATLNGGSANFLETALSALDGALPSSSYYGSRGVGVHMYHEPSNRVIIVGTRQLSTDYCFDFDTGYCNSLYGSTGAGATFDYGFAYEGNCIFGLGHSTIFWSFTFDMQAGCPGSSTSADIQKCMCNTEERWPDVILNFDTGPGTPYTVLDLQLLDPDGNKVWPLTEEWEDMVSHPDGILDLGEIDISHDYLTININVELDPTLPDPWLTGDPPTLTLGIQQVPHLVE